MSEQQGEKVDRRGTFWDWPVPVMIVCFVAGIVLNRAILLWWFLALVFAVIFMARRGTFSPRRRP